MVCGNRFIFLTKLSSAIGCSPSHVSTVALRPIILSLCKIWITPTTCLPIPFTHTPQKHHLTFSLRKVSSVHNRLRRPKQKAEWKERLMSPRLDANVDYTRGVKRRVMEMHQQHFWGICVALSVRKKEKEGSREGLTMKHVPITCGRPFSVSSGWGLGVIFVGLSRAFCPTLLLLLEYFRKMGWCHLNFPRCSILRRGDCPANVEPYSPLI